MDGFIPGEASIMLVLETESHAKSRGTQALSRITAFADGMEPEPYSSQKTSTGSGLSDAINGILQQTDPGKSFESAYCSLNGESYYAFEWGIQLTRLNKVFEKMKDLIHPAENCGDIGAATGGLLIACASKAFQHGYNVGEESLLWTAADNGQRMALCLQHLDC
ncbi:MAG: hypothetical protein IMF17_04315 [Proteobacteria bacterium]|nr:hypothetical protein [Pseudomonadota bacterium]